jgi:hypothetical protein
MKALKVGIASYDEMKAFTLRIAREEQSAADQPKVWFTSTESFSKVIAADPDLNHFCLSCRAPGEPRAPPPIPRGRSK